MRLNKPKWTTPKRAWRPTVKKVREALAQVKDFPALTSADGKITIIDKGPDGKHAGDAIKKGTLIQVQNGKFTPVGEGKAAAIKLR